MVFFCNFLRGRNAVNDGFKNILNSYDKYKKIIYTIPYGYEQNEFPNYFIKANILVSNHVFWGRILELYYFIVVIVKYKIKKIFMYYDNTFIHFIIAIIAFMCKIPVVVWVHDPILHTGESKSKSFIRLLNSRTMFKTCECIVVSYQKAIKELIAKYNVKESKINVIYLPEMLELEFNDIKNMNEEKIFDGMFFGRLEEYKGIDIFLKLIEDNPNKKFLLIGKGKLDISNRIVNYNNVSFINKYLDSRELAYYIKKSRIIVLPYKDATGTQTVQIANYYGIPVLASNVGCFAEYVKNSVNGYVCNYNIYSEFYDKFIYMLNHPISKEDIEDNFKKNFLMMKTCDKLWNCFT